MPNKTTLTAAQLEKLRQKLQQERKRIADVLRVAPADDPPEEQSELEEVAQRETERMASRRVFERERALLADVDLALSKLAIGAYGISEASGEPIPFARLAAIPWARVGAEED